MLINNYYSIYGWLHERARQSKLSCVVISHPSGLDGPFLPARDCPQILGKNSLPYYQSFIDQACLVEIAGHWLCSFLCVCNLEFTFYLYLDEILHPKI